MSIEFKDEPVPLVTVKEDGQLEIAFEGLDFLSNLKNKKIAILSINGPPKQNKTLLANSFIPFSPAFNSSESTPGLVMWGKPITLENGTELIIIDSQGLDKTLPHQCSEKLFIINLLLSTCFIYTTEQQINESSVQTLSYFLEEAANKIQIKCSDKEKGNNYYEKLSEYFPQFIWAVKEVETEKDLNIYLDEKLPANIKKLFLRRSCYVLQNKGDNVITDSAKVPGAEELLNQIKESIKTKTIDTFEIDGDSLFGILQNYLDAMNDEESPVILKAMENVLLSKGKAISELSFDNFKNTINKKLEGKYPMNITEIYKIYYDLVDKETNRFCTNVTGTLNVQQTGNYLNKIYARTRDELGNLIDTNKEYLDEWFDMTYKEIEKSLGNRDITNLEDMKMFFASYCTDLQVHLNKFLDMPNSEFNKNLISVLIKIYSDFVDVKFSIYFDHLNDNYNTLVKENTEKVEGLNLQIKKLMEQLNEEKKNSEKKHQESSDLNKTYLELESKCEKLQREIRAKEKEFQNNIDIEIKKNQKTEQYYQNQIQEKESIISGLETKIEKLSKELVEIGKEHSNKIAELNRENLKLNVEIERLKGEKKGSATTLDGKNLNIQTLFKGIQNTFMEFKESIDKLDRENQNVFKTQHLEMSAKDMERKSSEWINEIRLYREEQFKNMNENYEKELKKHKDEVEELNFELTKKEYEIKDQVQTNETLKQDLTEKTKLITENEKITKSKDELIKSQNVNLSIVENKLKTIETQKSDLEVRLNDSIVKFKTAEEETDMLVTIIESIFSKKKDKFERDIKYISGEYKDRIERAVKNVPKWFK